ncbi:hypothetical protein GCM10023084_37270 [Streptomyces lacrimifluminis]|uniref:Uncharacterized protein n=1 Tax=Streptomyces lacrimifluminis TaxID=1500077 RepID=A0A917L0F3_9ACTN|nr:hypothetical protein GCM10012282_36680 [Streptomyces lacrimifluminis]
MSPGPWTPPFKVTRYGRFGAKRRAVVKPTASSVCMPLKTQALSCRRRPWSVLRSEEGRGGEVGAGPRRWTALDGLSTCLSGVTLQEGEPAAILLINNATKCLVV